VERILDQAVADLALSVKTVLKSLELQKKPADLVLVGNLIRQHERISKPLREKLQIAYPQLRIIVPNQKPIMGAKKLAQWWLTEPERANFYLETAGLRD
jgi:N-acetylglucosamine kinase-like BadF-type ATPase